MKPLPSRCLFAAFALLASGCGLFTGKLSAGQRLPELDPHHGEKLPADRRAYVSFESNRPGTLVYLANVTPTATVLITEKKDGSQERTVISGEQAVVQPVCELPCNRWVEARRYAVMAPGNADSLPFTIGARTTPLNYRVRFADMKREETAGWLLGGAMVGAILGSLFVGRAAFADKSADFTDEKRQQAWILGGVSFGVAALAGIGAWLFWGGWETEVHNSKGARVALTPQGVRF